jgi:hypothetical protein
VILVRSAPSSHRSMPPAGGPPGPPPGDPPGRPSGLPAGGPPGPPAGLPPHALPSYAPPTMRFGAYSGPPAYPAPGGYAPPHGMMMPNFPPPLPPGWSEHIGEARLRYAVGAVLTSSAGRADAILLQFSVPRVDLCPPVIRAPSSSRPRLPRRPCPSRPRRRVTRRRGPCREKEEKGQAQSQGRGAGHDVAAHHDDRGTRLLL